METEGDEEVVGFGWEGRLKLPVSALIAGGDQGPLRCWTLVEEREVMSANRWADAPRHA